MKLNPFFHFFRWEHNFTFVGKGDISNFARSISNALQKLSAILKIYLKIYFFF